MLIRLYTLMRSLTQADLAKVPLTLGHGLTIAEDEDLIKSEDNNDVTPNSSSVGWGAWAMSLIPPVSLLVGEEVEGDSEDEAEDKEKSAQSQSLNNSEEKKEPPTIHYCVRAREMTLTFCALERVKGSNDGTSQRPSQRVHFLPFLKLSLERVEGDVVFRGIDRSHCILRYGQVRTII